MASNFTEWLRKVDAAVTATCGIGIDDLPDYAYSDYHEDGMTPKETARLVLQEEGF